MKILHYFLGFPPYRTGGLTKYSFDLMQAQVEQGDTVFALWPGLMSILQKKVRIKKKSNVNGIISFELINPLPVSLDEGVAKIDKYTQPCDGNVYIKFLESVRPAVIHIHTLMGLHKEFIEAANKLGIRTVFTTHDYYGLCPKVTFYRYGGVCDNDHDCIDCIQCNCSALSLKKIHIMQSPLYRVLKDSILLKKLRNRHRKTFFSNEIPSILTEQKSKYCKLSAGYRKLREYYIGMLSNIDMIHFNSTVTETIYRKFFTPKDSKVISITHHNIVDNRKNSITEASHLRLTYLAPAKPFKGFNVLKDALDSLWKEGHRSFKLKLFSLVENPSPYMQIQENGYVYNELGKIFSETDVLLAPSVWYETFGFTVLEAISYGVPVIVSDHVGSKDIIGNGGLIVSAGSANSLKKAIETLTHEKLQELRNNIWKNSKIKKWEDFLKENYSLYRG